MSVSDQLMGFDDNGAHLCGPPLDLMDHIRGYENVSFDSSKFTGRKQLEASYTKE